MTRKITVIINPRSGLWQRGKQIENKIIHNLERFGGEVTIVETSYRGEGCKLASRAVEEKVDTVVAVGGDGTINDIASSLVGTDVRLGVIPAGSGNGFARNFGIPLDFDKALDVIAREENVIRIDCGEANGHKFFNVVGFGLDAKIAKDFEQFGMRGVLPYFWLSFNALMKYDMSEMELGHSEIQTMVKPLSVVFANGKQFGNNAIIAPDADFSDGLLDLVVYNCQSKPLALIDAFRLLRGNIDKSKNINYVKVSQATVKINDGIHAHIDGEPIELGKEVSIKVVPNALNVLSTLQMKEGK